MKIRLAVLSCVLLAAVARPAAAAVAVQGGIGFIAVTGAAEGDEIVLRDRFGREAEHGNADRFGSFVFRELPQGARYTVTTPGGVLPVTTLRFDDHPDPSLYTSQTLSPGLNYIRMRDGTLLAAMVRLPTGKTAADGPFPTVVEYSGYAAADPDNPQPSTLIAWVEGYATVGVNMRGSGCSGGIIDLFDLPTTADGYDVIETVAAQPWALHGKVGMVGISFPGISQLYVAGARPPHLAAVAPLSVIADIYRAPGYPGGIFNNGFAQTWLQERNDDARPAPEGGQSWAVKRVMNGDTTCLANQKLRLQTLDAVDFTATHAFYEKALMDNRSPINWVANIQVPVFLSGSFQDEQTGSDFVSMLSRLPNRPDVKISLQNGIHASSLEPWNLYEWLAFLDIYVAQQLPDPGRIAPITSIIYQMILGNGTPTPPIPSDRFDNIHDLDVARALFESDPHVTVHMENGAGSAIAGLPATTFDVGFSEWPPNEVVPTTFYLGPDGTLVAARSGGVDAGVDAYRPDPAARPAQTIPGQGQSESWEIMPAYDWRPLVDGTGLAWATPPLAQDTVTVGPGNVDLWLRSSAPDTDLQVTLTEIRPDGLETYVQSGWLRASHRTLNRRRSTVLEPIPTHLERDARPLKAGRFNRVQVGLFAAAHVFRAGSRIRISVEAPGGDRTRWAFDTPVTNGQVLNEVAHMRAQASRLVLGIVPGVAVPQKAIPCPGLRGQPCRTYVPASNGG